MNKLWCQEVLEKDFSGEAPVGPELEEEVLKTDTELGIVPEWLRPLLWEEELVCRELEQAGEAILKKEVSAMTLPQFLAREAAATLVIIRRLDLLHEVFWFELRRAIPELQTRVNLALRKGYIVVSSFEEKERSKGVLIGLFG